MRRNGKTTRRIDEAIQSLFKNGSIILPSKMISEKQSRTLNIMRESEEFLNKSEIFIDHDWTKGIAQERFISVLINRLKVEHSFGSEIKKEDHQGFIVIRVK